MLPIPTVYKYLALLLGLAALWTSGFLYGYRKVPRMAAQVVPVEVERVVYKDRVVEKVVEVARERETETVTAPDGTVTVTERQKEKETTTDKDKVETATTDRTVAQAPAPSQPIYSLGILYRDPWERVGELRRLEATVGYRIYGDLWLEGNLRDGAGSIGMSYKFGR